jgi:hypothetical protein
MSMGFDFHDMWKAEEAKLKLATMVRSLQASGAISCLVSILQ